MKDKILIWFDISFNHFGLSHSLLKKHDCELYGIAEIPDKQKKFYQQQKIVNFQKLWFLHEQISKNSDVLDIKYLKSIEKKYDLCLWLIAYNDRLFYTYNEYYKFQTDEVLLILQQECKFYEKILDEIKPDFIIMFSPHQQHMELFYQICRARGIAVLLSGYTRLGSKMMISSELDKLDAAEEIPDNSEKQLTYTQIQDYMTKNGSFGHSFSGTKIWRKSNYHFFRSVLKYLFSDNTNPSTHYSYYGRTKLKVIYKMLAYTLKKRYREFFMNNNLQRKIDTTKPFIYLPLHQEQERVLLIGAPFYTNQLEVIKNVVKSLPVGYMLCIKEHPGSRYRAWRPVSVYKEILNLPNVCLLHPSVDHQTLMKNCSLVISIKGSASIEAQFYLKPSILFSDVGYFEIPSMYKIKTITELPKAIVKSLQKNVKISDVNKYIKISEKMSFEFNFDELLYDFSVRFNSGGYYVDMELKPDEIKLFLEDHREEFDKFAVEHVKKIKQHKSRFKN